VKLDLLLYILSGFPKFVSVILFNIYMKYNVSVLVKYNFLDFFKLLKKNSFLAFNYLNDICVVD